MKAIIFILLVVVALCAARRTYLDERVEFAKFIIKHGRNYKSEEETGKRFNIFKRNLKRIDALNRLSQSNAYGVSKFTDLTPSEFKHGYLMKKHPKVDYSRAPLYQAPPKAPLPSEFSWRKHNPNPITPVKNQGQCGSCWAFSAVETVESVWILAGKKEEILSEEQVVDCDNKDAGCDGGDTVTAFEYIIGAGGLESEKAYPYTARNQRCTFNKADVVANIKSFHFITKTKNETQMQQGLVDQGPLSICVDASSWQFYQGGIIKKHCGHQLDHCVQITGYGVQDGTKYWEVRNSWGTDWGMAGYLRVEMGKDLCGIAQEVTIAVV